MARQPAQVPGWSDLAREVGLNLARARARLGLSQARVAEMAGIAEGTYQRFEKGESRPGEPLNLQLFTLLTLCQVLDVAVEDVVPREQPDLTAGR
jgi:transcriptional regulator with XRE-family HTH domain